jgi:hypothetical protein
MGSQTAPTEKPDDALPEARAKAMGGTKMFQQDSDRKTDVSSKVFESLNRIDRSSESSVEDLFSTLDRNKDGVIDKEEFRSMFSEMKDIIIAERKKEKKARARLRLTVSVAITLVFIIAVIISGCSYTVYVLLEETKEVRSTDTGHATSALTNGRTTDIVGVREETETLPLYVAPVLPARQLASLDVVSVGVYDYELNARVTRLMRVTGVTLVNETCVVLKCGHDAIEVKNGRT